MNGKPCVQRGCSDKAHQEQETSLQLKMLWAVVLAPGGGCPVEGMAEPPAGQGLGWPAPSPVCALSCWPFPPSDFSSSALKASGRQGTLFFLQPSKFCCYSLDINGDSQAPESRGLPQQPSARPSAASTSKCIPRDFCPTGHMTLSRPELKHRPAAHQPYLRPASLRNAVPEHAGGMG